MKSTKIVVLFSIVLTFFVIAQFHERGIAQSQARIEIQPFLSGLSSPLFITHSRDGSGRLFVVEQPGRIQVFQPGSTAGSIFLDISARVLFGGERGLLGLTFHPRFAENRRFFVNYTRRPDGATVIAEYRVRADNPNLADNTETGLLTIPQPFANHNGGMVEFGPDGFLYIGMGDGGSANDPGNRAQNTEELLGKMLRIDVDRPDGQRLYSSPITNPFSGPAPGRDEIFAVGLRNPFRFSFDRLNGDLVVGDVGQNAVEEVDLVTVGANLGWRVFEGTRCTNLGPAACDPGSFTAPITQYNHTGGRCSITGGHVYRGSKSSLPFGSYIFGDFCTGEIFLFQNGAQRLLLDTNLSISSFGEDEAGELFVVSLSGTISRIVNPDAVEPAPVSISSFIVRKRASGVVIDPVTTRPNGKKFDIIVRGTGFQAGAVVLVNGVQMNTDPGAPPAEELIAKLRRPTLAVAGLFPVQVVNPDGGQSNVLMLRVSE